MNSQAGDLKYPESKRIDHVDNYHGTKVSDPYRWLEDLDSAETKDWVDRQNKVTFDYLSTLSEREKIHKRLTEVWNYERFGIPSRRGGKIFLLRNDGLQNQSVLYVQNSLEDEPRVLLDPNKLSADGTVAMMGFRPDREARYLAYGISRGGSDWREWFVKDIATGKDLSDHLKWIKFSGISWDKEGKGFFYGRYDEPKEGEAMEGVNEGQKLYYHKLGTPQSEDKLIYERPDRKDWGFGAGVTEDGRYLAVTVWMGTDPRNGFFYMDLEKKDAVMVELLNDFDASYSFLGNDGATFYFRTNLNAGRYKVISIDTENPDRKNWKTVIPEGKGTMSSVDMVAGGFVVTTMEDALDKPRFYKRNGSFVRDIELPGPGSVGGFNGRDEDTDTFYTFTNYTTPGTIFRYDFKTGKSTVFRAPKLAVDTTQFTSEQVFYKSKDGTRVPMTISYKKGTQMNGANPTLLYGYGGFNVSLTPSFQVPNLVWMDMGGVLAVPNLRGGGEYGKEWHEAGTKERKQNVFDDFIAAAEYLIAEKYTSPNHLSILGGSNGGLLVGACMTQRPDLFAAAVPAVGVLDMLRFHKFTIGWAWVSDYGSSDNAEDFKYLYAYSPLHNLKPGVEYPATLIMTSDHDDRVVPSHSFKFASNLQHNHRGANPVLIRIETDAGHGAGTATSKQIEGAADRIAFMRAHAKGKKSRSF
ncbi:MAG: prolyl oligopeptidase family serine peptidase [Acidobacteriota bacterium]|nr:prolyl oligopeptidase family serine peptidase [Acidobacteriota bacterium]